MPDFRHHPRIHEGADVIVKIQSAPGLHALEGRVFPCQSMDVSTSGMRLQVEIETPVGALLELEIYFSRSEHKFRHLGNVVWCRSNADEEQQAYPHRHIGIRFNTANNPQFHAWATQISNLLETRQ
jgi:hypothetical protein